MFLFMLCFWQPFQSPFTSIPVEEIYADSDNEQYEILWALRMKEA